jgi:hypothetical protein
VHGMSVQVELRAVTGTLDFMVTGAECDHALPVGADMVGTVIVQ